MEFHLLRVYFKAAVLVPFYLSLATCLLFLIPISQRVEGSLLDSPAFMEIVQVPLFSGIIGVCTLTAFLNTRLKVARSLRLSLLSWALAPYCCIAILLATQIEWPINDANKGQYLFAVPFIIICFFHVIGIIIAYIDFRKSMWNYLEEERIKNLQVLDETKELKALGESSSACKENAVS